MSNSLCFSHWSPDTDEECDAGNLYLYQTGQLKREFEKYAYTNPQTGERSVPWRPVGSRMRQDILTVNRLWKSGKYDIDGFRVAPSDHLKNIGVSDLANGLYATRAIPAGKVFGKYLGRIISSDAAEDLANENVPGRTAYLFDVCGPGLKPMCVIDGKSEADSSLLRYVNHSTDESLQNAEFIQVDDSIYMRATQNIGAGQEIIGDYGDMAEQLIHQSDSSVSMASSSDTEDEDEDWYIDPQFFYAQRVSVPVRKRKLPQTGVPSRAKRRRTEMPFFT